MSSRTSTTADSGGFRRFAMRFALPACMTLGVLAALAVVVAWFPKGQAAWNYPLHQIDAPAHYYFIRKILDDGLSVATHLWPNDAYYPPLFHLLAAGLIKLAGLFGVNVNIYTAFNVVWIATSGLAWPAAMQLLASYWTCRGLRADGRELRASGRGLAFPCVMALVVPLLAVASASHPFQMLASGPLIAYGMATTLLPFWLYVTLRLFDVIAAHEWHGRRGGRAEDHGRADLVRWTIAFVLVGGLDIFAHPRIAFTWLLFIGPFLLLRLPWKLIVAALAAVVVAAAAFFAYMVTHYKSGRYFNPADWFHTYQPNRTVPDALRVFATDNISGPAGVFMAVMVIAAVLVTCAVALCAVRPIASRVSRTSRIRVSDAALCKDAVSVLLMVFLFGLVYVCSTALTGWFPNIVAAAWYRAETRPLTMIPFAIVTLLVFAASALCRVGGEERNERMPHTPHTPSIPYALRTPITLVLLAALAVSCQFGGATWGNSTRAVLADNVYTNMQLTDDQPDEQLTATKLEILEDVSRTVGDDAVVISDPLNGSMYGKTVFDTNMLYPIYNPMAEKNGAIFGEVERAFDSGNKTTVLDTVCPIGETTPEYFLVMGGQAPSLKMFTFRQQYDPFHNTETIAKYERNGTLVKIRDYSDKGDYAKGWALYRFGCSD